jgi:hypothetical protein
MSTKTPGTRDFAPTSPTTDRIRSRIAHLRTFYAGRLADSQAELAKVERADLAFSIGLYQGRIAAFKLILADLDKLAEGCRHA